MYNYYFSATDEQQVEEDDTIDNMVEPALPAILFLDASDTDVEPDDDDVPDMPAG